MSLSKQGGSKFKQWFDEQIKQPVSVELLIGFLPGSMERTRISRRTKKVTVNRDGSVKIGGFKKTTRKKRASGLP